MTGNRRDGLELKTAANTVLWMVVLTIGASIFGSPAAAFAEYWYWWPSQAKAETVNALAVFGFGAVVLGGWGAINKPDRTGLVAAVILTVLVAMAIEAGTVDCRYFFRCPDP